MIAVFLSSSRQIAFVSRLENLDILKDENDHRAVAMKKSLEDNTCRDHFLSAARGTEIPEPCQDALR